MVFSEHFFSPNDWNGKFHQEIPAKFRIRMILFKQYFFFPRIKYKNPRFGISSNLVKSALWANSNSRDRDW